MAKSAAQRGPQTEPIDRYYGRNDIGQPGGVNTQIGDYNPTAVPPHQFLQLINTRWRGSVIVSRPGQSKVNTTALATGAEVHPVNFELGAPLRVWLVGKGCPQHSDSTGMYLAYYDPEQCPRLQRVSWYQTAVAPAVVFSYGGVPHAVIDSQLRRLQLGKVPWGSEAIDIAGSTAEMPLANLPTGYRANSAIEFDGKAFIACDDGGGNGKIMVWDGTSFQTDLTGIAPPQALGLYRDTMIVGFLAAANKIMVRPRGGAGATYVTVTPGAGTVQTYRGNDTIESFNDVAYGAGGNTAVWSYDGTTLTAAAHTIAGSTQQALVVEYGTLIAGYKSATNKPTLATFNGSSWTDVAKDLSVEAPTATDVLGLERYRGAVVAAVVPASAPAKLLISPPNTITGTWDATVSFSGANVGDVYFAQAF